jgi:hypothetical protein
LAPEGANLTLPGQDALARAQCYEER